MIPPLPEQPMPNAAIVQSSTTCKSNWVDYGEQALLSEEEKMIKLKNRGWFNGTIFKKLLYKFKP